MKIQPKNWEKFQHYKHRTPPWIKLHRDLLVNKDYMSLPVESMAIAPLLWLLASESKEGVIDGAIDLLAWRLHIASNVLALGIAGLIKSKFINVLDGDASNVLAECLQHATTEREYRVQSTEKTLKSPPPTPSMTLAEIRLMFRDRVGQELGGGVNQTLVEICQAYTPAAIENAILATSTRLPKPVNPFMYFQKVLKGSTLDAGSQEVFDVNKDYPDGSFYAAMKADMLKQGAANAT